MDRLISEKAVLEAFREYQGSISDFYKAVKAIPSAEYETEIAKYSDDEKYKALITLYFASINCEDKEKRKRYNTAIKLIEGIPSAEPKTEWIPVSERLPEEKKAVLVWCPQYKNIYCAYLEKEQWWIFGAFVQIVPNEVVAWMPLPPCYDPQESEDKECTKKI